MIITALLCLLIGLSIILVYPQLPLSIISVDKIELAPKGSIDDLGKVTGGFWRITLTIDQVESLSGIKFDKTGITTYGGAHKDLGKWYIDGQEVQPSGSIDLTFKPIETPYYETPLIRDWIQVVPETYWSIDASPYTLRYYDEGYGQTWLDRVMKFEDLREDYGTNAQELVVETLKLLDYHWTINNFFTITVEKTSGEQTFGPKTYSFNSKPGNTTWSIPIPDDLDAPENAIYIKQLGLLEQGITEPNMRPFTYITEIGGDHAYPWEYDLQRALSYDKDATEPLSFSNEWYGPRDATGADGLWGWRWNFEDDLGQGPTDNPKFTWKTPVWEYKGWDSRLEYVWEDYHETNRVEYYYGIPTAPTVDDLEAHLVNKGFTTDMVNLNHYGEGYNIDDVKYQVMCSYAPRPLVYIDISTELVDTVVVSPHIGEVEITYLEWETGEALPLIGDKLKATMRIKNVASVDATFDVWAEITSTSAKVEPYAMHSTIDAGVEIEQEFTIYNLGVKDQTEFTVTWYIKCTADPTGTIQAEASLKGVFIVAKGTLIVFTTGEEPPNTGVIFVNDIEKQRNIGTQYQENVPVGEYVISFGDVEGSATPESKTVFVAEGETEIVEGIYIFISDPYIAHSFTGWYVDDVKQERRPTVSVGKTVVLKIRITATDGDTIGKVRIDITGNTRTMGADDYVYKYKSFTISLQDGQSDSLAMSFNVGDDYGYYYKVYWEGLLIYSGTDLARPEVFSQTWWQANMFLIIGVILVVSLVGITYASQQKQFKRYFSSKRTIRR